MAAKTSETTPAENDFSEEDLEQEKIEFAQGGSDFLPEDKEKHLFHVNLDKPSFSSTTGEKLSIAYVQKFTQAEWRQFSNNSRSLGYEITVLWNPIKYNK